VLFLGKRWFRADSIGKNGGAGDETRPRPRRAFLVKEQKVRYVELALEHGVERQLLFVLH